MKTILLFFFATVVHLHASEPIFETLPLTPPIPTDNPQTLKKIHLGKQLFFDPRISKLGLTSCFTCHNLMSSGENNLPNSVKPDGTHSRHAVPTVWNAAFLSAFFWSRSAATLEEQAEAPLEEMGLGNVDEIVKRVRAIPGYARQFSQVFPEKDSVNLSNIAKALASYERTLITPDSPYDRYLKGGGNEFPSSARRGMELFRSVGCISCHSGTAFSGKTEIFQKFPVYPTQEYEQKFHFSEDLGRYNVTEKEADKNVWRIPTLRNVELTAPYFHNGSVKDLNEAVRIMAKVQLGRDLSEEQIQDLVAFLRRLTGKLPKQSMPELPRLPDLTQFPS